MFMQAPSDSSSTSTSSDTSVDSTEIIDISNSILDKPPSGVSISYFDQNTGIISPDYVYSKTGKSYLKPLNTRFLFVQTSDSPVTVTVMYGNTK
jgi:hypothetical protein